MKIIINEWEGYPLRRDKYIGRERTVECGLEPMLESFAKFNPGLDFEVVIVINCKESLLSKFKQFFSKDYEFGSETVREKFGFLKDKYSFVEQILYRGNLGSDIGSHDYALKRLRECNYSGDIIFMNSSVRGATSDKWLKTYQDLFYSKKKIGLTGISINSHNTNYKPPRFAPHVQSFFLFTNTQVLDEVFPESLPGASETNKLKLIEKGEIGISEKVLEAGYGINCRLLGDFSFFKGNDYTAPEGDIRNHPEFKDEANQL